VLNLGHGDDEFDAVTEVQRRELMPRLAALLDGKERLALDLGCGPGRFCRDLQQAIGGRVVGVDVADELLALAPSAPAVEYRRMSEGRIPLEDGAADLVWSCLTLGGIVEPVLGRTVAEVARVLSPSGLLFLVENTADRVDAPHWAFRSLEAYCALFPFVALRHLGDYDDLGERISILAGRRAL
jgi:SAM-dependent methyltransferase